MKRFTRKLFKLKDLNSILAESHVPDHRLKKVLGPFELILLGVGVIIGAGIFATVGTAAAGGREPGLHSYFHSASPRWRVASPRSATRSSLRSCRSPAALILILTRRSGNWSRGSSAGT